MNEKSSPLDYLIECCEIGTKTGKWKLDRFLVSNAKHELKKLRQSKSDMSYDAFQANKNSVEDNNRWLSCESELCKLKEKIKAILSHPVAYGLINERHDLYNLSLYHNPYEDPNKLIPLYSNKEEFLTGAWKNGKLSE